jgi:hypothetical protein
LAVNAASYSTQLSQLQAPLAAQPTNTTLLFKLGDLCHDEGVNDNPEAVKLAEKYLSKLLALEPTNALARALYGSTLTMRARDTFWPGTRLSHVRTGIKEMDAAVKLAPNDPQVRFIRANNNYFMPKWLGREDIVQADYQWLWSVVKSQPETLKAETRQTIALRHGLLLRKQQQTSSAIAVWKAGVEIAPQSEFAVEMKKELKKAEADERK